MLKKYELTDETKVICGHTLHRIKAITSFGIVMAGELGGWVEKEDNLDHDGYAWIFGNALAFEDARICGNAQVFGDAWVFGNARVYDNARVYGRAWVHGDAHVFENARIYGESKVFDDARVYWKAQVSGKAVVYGQSKIFGNARVFDVANVSGNARVLNNALIYGNTQVFDNAIVSDTAQIFGNARVFGNAVVSGDAMVYGVGAIFWIGGIGSRNSTTTFFACKDKEIRVVCGCFFGTLEEFRANVKRKHGDNQHAKVYMLAIEMAKERIRFERN